MNIKIPQQKCNDLQKITPDTKLVSSNFISTTDASHKIDTVNTHPEHIKKIREKTILPVNFSWITEGGNQIENGGRNQQQCGCCWAMATTSVLGDRYALKYNIEAPYPSVLDLVSCCGPQVFPSIPAQQQCNEGGNIYLAGKWLEKNSIGLEKCFPFQLINVPNKYVYSNENNIQNSYIAPTCPYNSGFTQNDCFNCKDNKYSEGKFSVKENSTEHVYMFNDGEYDTQATINAIKTEIYGNGPVCTSILEPCSPGCKVSEFNSWWNENADTDKIYVPSYPPSTNLGHGIVIVGWGVQDGIDYWIIRNSWGIPYGKKAGICRIAMSTSTPHSNWIGIDVPITINGNTYGGVVSFLPGELRPDDKTYWSEGNGLKPSGISWKQPSSVNRIINNLQYQFKIHNIKPIYALIVFIVFIIILII